MDLPLAIKKCEDGVKRARYCATSARLPWGVWYQKNTMVRRHVQLCTTASTLFGALHLHHAYASFPSHQRVHRLLSRLLPNTCTLGVRGVAAGCGLWSRPRFDDSFCVRTLLCESESPSADFFHLSFSGLQGTHALATIRPAGTGRSHSQCQLVYLDKALKVTVLVIYYLRSIS
jgi:hypothetical protein